MSEGGPVSEDYEIRYSLARRDWLRTEWPAVLVWVAVPAVLLLGVVAATIYISAWWALALPVWFLLGGAKAAGLLLFLVRGSQVLVQVKADGAIFVSESGSEPVYGHWVGFEDQGETFLLWGADGRYRLVIPKRALTPADYAAFRERVGVDLEGLQVGQEVKIKAAAERGVPR